MMDRRTFVAAGAGIAVTAARAVAQALPVPPAPAPRDWSRLEPIAYPDPDIVALDSRFNRYIVRNTPIRRLHVGTLWAEGPAWNGVGRYLVWSDIPNNVQMRWLDEDAHVSTFRSPAGNSNGNTFDYQGRQLSCEHGGRRVVRYEANGQVTVIAESFQGKRLNSPNDIVVDPDGDIWFTDPTYGICGQLRRLQGGSRIPGGRLSRRWPDWTDRQGERRLRRAERDLLLAGLQETLRRRHWRTAGDSRLRRGRNRAAQWPARSSSSTFPAPVQHRRRTGSAVMSMATSGLVRDPECR